jgi:predicted nucleotidyltransferase
MERRAIEWLASHGLIEGGVAGREGDAHPESDIDLLVVLDRVDSPWEKLRRMDEILWRHSYNNDAVISAVPVAERDLTDAPHPLLVRAQVEGRAVA